MTISDIAAALMGEGMMTKYTGGGERPSRDEIARLAYQFDETPGRRPLIITRMAGLGLRAPSSFVRSRRAGANSNSGWQNAIYPVMWHRQKSFTVADVNWYRSTIP